jgi:hypothetical protein
MDLNVRERFRDVGGFEKQWWIVGYKSWSDGNRKRLVFV